MKLYLSANAKSHLRIKPLDFDLSELSGLTLYVKYLNGLIDNGEILIPISDVDINSLYVKIKTLFKDKYDCDIISNEDSDSILDEARIESEKFEKFSEKALQIRNDNVDAEELANFTRLIKREHFKRELKPFQLLASYHLAFSQNACNFSVPGSGKTTTVLAAYDYLKNTEDEHKKIDKLVVIGPLAAFIAWKKEFEQCYGFAPNVIEIRGGISTKTIEDSLMVSNVQADMIIASYGSVDSKKDILTHFLKNNKAMVVLDEAHRIKNVEDGIQSNAALSLSKYARSRVILTGTPAANSYVDLYNLYKFIWPANNIIGYSVPQLSTIGKFPNDSRVSDLINKISPFFIRVKKTDLGLPEPIYHDPLIIDMQPIQEKIYNAIESMAIRTFENHNLNSVFKKSALIRLRQAATNPNLLNKPLADYYDSIDGDSDYIKKTELVDEIDISDDILQLIRNYTKSEVPSKFVKAKDLALEIINNGGKLLIWSEFVGTGQDLSFYLKEQGINNMLLYGATSQEDRELIINEFHENDSSFKVIIANPHAVGESISLHKACHNALYLEQGYNAGSYMQSKDRIHRVGLLPEDKTNYYFIHSSPIDTQIYDRVNEKERKMLEIIESEEIPLLANNLDFFDDTESDIKSIIRSYYERR